MFDSSEVAEDSVLKDEVSYPKGRVQIFIEEFGKSFLHWKDSNLVVNESRRILAHLVRNADTNFRVFQLRLGVGGHVSGDILNPLPPTIGDVNLNSTFFNKNPQTVDFIENQTGLRFTFKLGNNEGNGAGVVAYTEAGLFTANGLMFARETFEGLVKKDTRAIVFVWEILF